MPCWRALGYWYFSKGLALNSLLILVGNVAKVNICAVLRNYGVLDQPAAVAILKGRNQAIGLVRIVQTSSSCVVEATVDKLAIGEYCVNIHQLGDLSSGGYRYLSIFVKLRGVY